MSDLQPVWAAFSEWLRHVDSILAKGHTACLDGEKAAIAGDIKGFGSAFGEAHGQIINARKELANALSRGIDLPSES